MNRISTYSWAEVPEAQENFSARNENALYLVQEFATQGRLATDDVEALVEQVVQRCAAKPVEFQRDALRRTNLPEGYASGLVGTRFLVPTGGALDAIKPIMGEKPLVIQIAGLPHFCFDIKFQERDLKAAAENGSDLFSADLNVELDNTQKFVDLINLPIEQARVRMEKLVRTKMTVLRDRQKLLHDALEPLNIPLHFDETIEISLEPTALTFEQAQSQGLNHKNFKLSDDIADAVIRSIRSFAVALERSPGTAGKLLDLRDENLVDLPTEILSLPEETIRDILLMVLNANWRGQATGETFNGRGKTDILLRHEERNALIVECKIWRGETGFREALEQLAGYQVWSDTRAAILLIIRLEKPSLAIQTAQAEIKTHDDFVSVEHEDDQGGTYKMRSSQDPARFILLELLPIVMPPKVKPTKVNKNKLKEDSGDQEEPKPASSAGDGEPVARDVSGPA